MNNKSLILIALALCLCFVLPVAAVGTYYENKYVETNNEIPSDGCGQLVITTLTKHSLIGAEFNLTRVDAGSFPFTNGQLIDKIQYDALNKVAEPYQFVLDHNGQWDERVAPGTYAIFKPDDNGGQPAYAIVTVTKGYTATVVFQGHGVSMGDEVCKPSYTIIDAKYGLWHCSDVIIHHGDYTREWIEVTYDRYVDVGKNNGDYKYSNHWGYYWVGRNNGNYDKIEGIRAHWEYTDVGMGNGDYIKNHQRGHNCNEYVYVEPTTECQTDGVVEDVTSNVQNAVAQGYTSFLFRNDFTDGGIFDITSTTLLSKIDDPAVGIVKDVTIKYSNGCGSDREIITKEYCTINLVTGSATCPSQQTT